ncbi:MAG: flagellar assembly protein FliW [Solirubrobacterales bacterium]
MQISTVRFGDIEVKEEQIARFPLGIPGFDQEKGFILIQLEPTSPFYFMQSTITASLAFMVTNPRIFFPDYELHISSDVLAFLGTEKEEDLDVYVLLSIPEDFHATTANLLAPIVINRTANVAVQSIPPQSPYSTKQPLFPKRDSGDQSRVG